MRPTEFWDPETNPSPFPDEIWRELAREHNDEQHALRELFLRLHEAALPERLPEGDS